MDALISRQNFKISKSQRTRMKPVDVCKVRCSFSLPRNHVPRLFFFSHSVICTDGSATEGCRSIQIRSRNRRDERVSRYSRSINVSSFCMRRQASRSCFAFLDEKKKGSGFFLGIKITSSWGCQTCSLEQPGGSSSPPLSTACLSTGQKKQGAV